MDDEDYEVVDPSLIHIPPYFEDDLVEDQTPERPQLSALIGLREVVEAMGLEPSKTAMQALRRQIQAKEAMSQTKILVQATVGGKYVTTMGALRRFMPELFVDEEISSMAKILIALKEELEILQKRIEDLEGSHSASNGFMKKT